VNIDCRNVQDMLLDMAYPESGEADGQGRLDKDISTTDVARHLKNCPECRDYADALVDIASLLPSSHVNVPSGSAERPATTDLGIEGIAPAWPRLDATIERGIKMRIARERRNMALFALTATGILTSVWVPLLASNPDAFLDLQAIGFFGIALFYLPLHVLREGRGDVA
jgi:predicted anti-sigma-YlaC factor YlaD